LEARHEASWQFDQFGHERSLGCGFHLLVWRLASQKAGLASDDNFKCGANACAESRAEASRAVKLGRRGEGYVEITDGLKPDEEVVTSANFLIDAESNLKAALQTFSQQETQP
jgi:multidrug efflux pump subunit AcrA (membrane-fusion protein)